ncbi:hypothetical protein ACWEWU_10820 [Staphylococcus xylosus]
MDEDKKVKIVEPDYELVHIDYAIDYSLKEYINRELARRLEDNEHCSVEELTNLIKLHDEITTPQKKTNVLEFTFNTGLVFIILSIVLLLLVLSLTL